MTYQASYPQGVAESIRSNSGWFIALGIIFIIGGIVAIAAPMISSLVVAAIVGVTLAIVVNVSCCARPLGSTGVRPSADPGIAEARCAVVQTGAGCRCPASPR